MNSPLLRDVYNSTEGSSVASNRNRLCLVLSTSIVGVCIRVLQRNRSVGYIHKYYTFCVYVCIVRDLFQEIGLNCFGA